MINLLKLMSVQWLYDKNVLIPWKETLSYLRMKDHDAYNLG